MSLRLWRNRGRRGWIDPRDPPEACSGDSDDPTFVLVIDLINGVVDLGYRDGDTWFISNMRFNQRPQPRSTRQIGGWRPLPKVAKQ